MDVTKAVSAYIQRMITEVSGIKVLLLDQDTTPIISTSFTQSSLLSHEVYLTDRVDNFSRDRMRHLNCIALLRPTPQSISALARELRQPRYKSYWLYFTNVLQKQDIELLAEADSLQITCQSTRISSRSTLTHHLHASGQMTLPLGINKVLISTSKDSWRFSSALKRDLSSDMSE